MPSSNTDKLLEVLITQVSTLAESVQALVIIDAGRLEKDKHQELTNRKFERHIDAVGPVVSRMALFLATWDKVKVWIIIAAIGALVTALKFNFAA